nr:hypothetical protein [Tanacetum cinerariifolium]
MLVQHQVPEGEDEAVNQEEGNIVERAITTNASLKAAQNSDNIIKTQTMAMPTIDIPQGIDTGGSPRRQETKGGTSAQTRSKRVLEQPNEPPLTEGHTSRSREGRLKENIELTDTVPTPHDSPLTGGYTPGSDEGRITLAELMETYATSVKKLESQLKQKRSRVVIHSLDNEGPSVHIEDSPKHGRIIEEIDKDENINLTELLKKLKKKEMIQLSLDEELAQKLYAKELAKEEARQEQERYNLEKSLELQRQLDQRKENVPKGNQAKEIDWNDP